MDIIEDPTKLNLELIQEDTGKKSPKKGKYKKHNKFCNHHANDGLEGTPEQHEKFLNCECGQFFCIDLAHPLTYKKPKKRASDQEQAEKVDTKLLSVLPIVACGYQPEFFEDESENSDEEQKNDVERVKKPEFKEQLKGFVPLSMEYDLRSARKNVEVVKAFQAGFGVRPTEDYMRDVGAHDFVRMELAEIGEKQPEKHTVESATTLIKTWLQKLNFRPYFQEKAKGHGFPGELILYITGIGSK